MGRSLKLALLVLAGLVVAGGCFLAGRLTAPSRSSGAVVGDYFDGLSAGEAQGREEGRVLQEGSELPARDRRVAHDSFVAGYTAGMNDAFAGYDGGWALGVPWIVTIEEGSGAVAYRIRDRTAVRPGVDYFLCADGHTVCHQPHR